MFFHRPYGGERNRRAERDNRGTPITAGGKAVRIAWAALLKNEVEVARDTHVGLSGSRKAG